MLGEVLLLALTGDAEVEDAVEGDHDETGAGVRSLMTGTCTVVGHSSALLLAMRSSSLGTR